MGENIYRLLLEELTDIRVVCKCGAAVELPLSELGHLDRSECPKCHQPYGHRVGGQLSDNLTHFQLAIADLARLKNITVEFPLRLRESREDGDK